MNRMFAQQQCVSFEMPPSEYLTQGSVKKVGTILEVASTMDRYYYKAANWVNVPDLAAVPLYSWIPRFEDYLAQAQAQKSEWTLFEWINVVISWDSADGEEILHLARDVLERKEMHRAAQVEARLRKEIQQSPFGITRKGVYFVNWSGDHSAWRGALKLACKSIRADPARTMTAFFSLWKKKKEESLGEKLYEKNRRSLDYTIDNYVDDMTNSKTLREFATANPGKHGIIWQGIRFSRLADAVFERLYVKLEAWVRALSLVEKVLLEKYIYIPSLEHFYRVLKAGWVFLVEMSPESMGGMENTSGFVTYQPRHNPDHTPLAIHLRFRESFNNPDRVVPEENLFFYMIHEVAHLVGDPRHQLQEMADDTSDANEADDIFHPVEFYRIFKLFYAVARSVGFVGIPGGGKEEGDWKLDDSFDDLKAFHDRHRPMPLYTKGTVLEDHILKNNPRKPTDPSSTLESDDDGDNDEDAMKIQSAYYSSLFSRYLGTPVTRADIQTIVAHWRGRGELNACLSDVFSQPTLHTARK